MSVTNSSLNNALKCFDRQKIRNTKQKINQYTTQNFAKHQNQMECLIEALVLKSAQLNGKKTQKINNLSFDSK